jgi:uncharacterized protein YceK
MKRRIQVLFAVAVIGFAGCGSDRTRNNDKDSLMTDRAVIDNEYESHPGLS